MKAMGVSCHSWTDVEGSQRVPEALGVSTGH